MLNSVKLLTGIVYDMTVVTRDTIDMEKSGAKLFNPWK